GVPGAGSVRGPPTPCGRDRTPTANHLTLSSPGARIVSDGSLPSELKFLAKTGHSKSEFLRNCRICAEPDRFSRSMRNSLPRVFPRPRLTSLLLQGGQDRLHHGE